MNQLNSHQFEQVYKWLGINLNKLGCVMLDVEPLSNMWSIEQEGAGILLYKSPNKERWWIDGWVADKNPHITLLYGLLEEGKNFELHIQEVLKGWNLDEVEIEEIGYFNSPYPDEPYYCIVAYIKVTDELLEGHRRLEFLPHINTFTGYKPHMTIAYIRKDEATRDNLINDFNKLWRGKKLKVKSEINLGGNK